MASRSRTHKLLLTTLVVGATGTVAGLGSFAAFTATTSNANNSITSGTVIVGDNDSGGTMYTLPNQGPGSVATRCIRVTYTGSLTATVRLYAAGTISNGSTFNLQVERGSGTTGSFPSCTGFSPAATLYNGALGSFPSTYAAGPDAKGSTWATNNTVDYRFTITVNDDTTPNAHTAPLSSGLHGFTWEARNT